MGGCCCCPTSSRVSSVKGDARSFPDSSYSFEGPVKDRSCTDGIFLILLSVYLIFLLVGVGIAGVRGNPRRLIYGVDEYGNICGLKNQRISGANQSGVDYSGVKYLTVSQQCTDGTCRTKKQCEKECPEDYEKTTLRRCLAKKVTNTGNKILQSTLPFLEEVGSDISLCWKEIILLCMISVGLSLLLLIIFRYCASIIIWAVLIIVTIASIAVTIYVWVMWRQKKKDLESYEGPNKDLKEKQVGYWFAAAIIVTIFTVVYLLVVLIMRNKIKLVAALFQEAGKSVATMPLILLQPVLTFISITVIFCFQLVGLVFLQTSGKPLVDSEGRVTFPVEKFFQVLRWLLCFGFIWLSQFVLACQNFIVAGAVSTWYFTRDKRKLRNPICKSFRILVCYHLGSVAFGSLIIAIMKLIRVLFRLLEKHLNNQNQRCEIFWKIFQCCLACFENFLKFLSKNAYIMIAIYGDSFCTSARRAFGSLTSNAMRVAAVDSIGDFILFVGKVGVTVAIAFIALEILKNVEGLHYIWVPVALSCLFAFLCCHCFLSVYEMAIDTLLLCFCEDCQMNDGITRPYFMSRSLMVFVERSRKSAKIGHLPKGKSVD